MFYGRKKELAEIKEALKTDRFESFLVYGRRRIGKTELVNEALKDSSRLIIFYECAKTSVEENLYLFTMKIKKIFNEDHISFNSFSALFSYLFNKSLSQDIVLFIDEFSFLLDEDFTIESKLAVVIDEYKNKSNLKLFVSGSYVSLMEKMIEYGSHSYGRYTHIMLINTFDYYDSSLFYSNYTNEEKVMMYSVFGGVPFFNSLIDTKKSALENVFDLVIRRNSVLEHEISEMILAETNKIANMNYLITMIARGIVKYKDLSSNMASKGISKPDYLLGKLIEMDIVKKVFPINDESNKKKTNYVFKDNLLNFYYKYIFFSPYQEFRENPKFFYENFIKDDFEKKYVPKKFEMISMEYLTRANYNYLIDPIILKIGSYSYNDASKKINREFDVVTLDKIGYISYECKYTNSLVNINVIKEEEEQTSDSKLPFYKLGFISKNGFEEKIDKSKYNLIELNDMYK
ncbi:MAG: AAA family ATPase [Bacilli bacterium]|nr:AAA family ATPase [Bacilli bacterium]